ncbi:MAG TPA: dTDP-4-dehydrorhamnose reductase [Verrucomicrobiae bacterium]|nr:dTDP-4-dehydrorhamnose reductase [Verrucomicrobiae bacterium]
MMRVLIIGSKGNLGQALAEAYAEVKPVLWDREEIDITNEEECKSKVAALQPTLVYNCAAYNKVDDAEKEIEIAETINGYAVGFLATVCRDIGATMVHFSSNYVFDGQNAEGYNEDDKPSPKSAYARSKRLGEIELQQNMDNYYLVRTAWLYGAKTQGKKSFVDIMLDMASAGKTINAVNDEFGNPTYVKDLAQALVALTQSEKPFGIYHLTNAGSTSWFEWAKEIFKIRSIKANINAIPSGELKRPANRPKYGILNNTKFIELRPWSEALREYLQS